MYTYNVYVTRTYLYIYVYTMQLAWAPGRGVKGAGLKAFWDQEVGSSYIPWSFIKTQTDVDTMAAGAWIDIATIPPGLKEPPAGNLVHNTF